MRSSSRFSVRRLLLLGAGVLCLVLVVGDVVVGSWIEGRVAERIGCRFAVADGAEAEVDVAGWPASLPLLTGTVPDVRVSAEDARLVDGLDGDLEVELHDVDRTDDGMSTGGGDAVLTVAWADVAARFDRPGVTLSGSDGAVVAQLDTGLLPVAVVARPEVGEGRLRLDPVAVRVGDQELSGAFADRMISRLGGRLDLLSDGWELPSRAGLSLDGVAGTADGLALDFAIAPGPLGQGLGGGRC